MPLQCSTQWDGLGHIFDHGNAWNGRRAGEVVTSEGDLVTGIENVAGLIAGRGVLLDVGRVIGTDGELPDGFAITAEHLEATIAAQGEPSRRPRRPRPGPHRAADPRPPREGGWGDYAGGPAPGLSFTTADWLHRTEIAAIATDTWGFEVRPNEFDVAFQPLHQVVHPQHRSVGRRDVGPRRARRRLRRGRRLRVLAHRRSPAHHRRRRLARQPDRRQVGGTHARRQQRARGRRRHRRTATAILLAKAGVAVDLIEIKPDVAALGSGITLQGNALRVLQRARRLGPGAAAGYAFDITGLRAPDPAGTVVFEVPDAKTGGPDLPAVMGMPRPELAHILVDRATEVGAKLRLRHHVHRARPRTTPESTSPSPTARPAATTSSSARTASAPGPAARSASTWRPKSVGMGIWRAFGPRPASVTRTDLIYGGPSYIAGYCPTGEDSLYAYIVEDAQDRCTLSPRSSWRRCAALQAYHGPWDEIRESLPTRRGQLHVVRDPRLAGALEPGPRRAHRRRRTHLPAHHRPGRRAGPGGRRRPRRAARRARQARPGPVGRLHRPSLRAREDRRRRSNQLAQWQLDHVQGDIPASCADRRCSPASPPERETHP